MDHPSKRRRLSSNEERDTSDTEKLPQQEDDFGPSMRSIGSKRHQGHAKLHHRHNHHNDLLPQRPVEPRANTDTTVTDTATVVDVIINDGTSNIAALTIPNVSTVVSVGSLTLTVDPITETTAQSTTAAPSGTTTAASSSTASSQQGSQTTTAPLTSKPMESSNSSTTTFMTISETVINGTTTTLPFPTLVSISNSSTSSRTDSLLHSSSGHKSLTTSGGTVSASSTAQTTGSSTSGAGAAGGGTATGSGAGSASSSGSSSGSGSSASGPTTRIVGGVVGGVAGLALVLVLLLYLLKAYRKHLQRKGALPPSPTSGQLPPTSELGAGHNAFTAAVFGRWRPSSQTAGATPASEVQSSERGFQKLGGRKLTGVLSGGDPYGGNYGAFEQEDRGQPPPTERDSFVRPNDSDLRNSSFYHDSMGFHGGPSTAPANGVSTSDTRDFVRGQPTVPEDGLPVMRPSPARTPVQASASVTSLPRTASSSVPATPRVAGGQDGVGRSLSTHDGSRGSRFTERV